MLLSAFLLEIPAIAADTAVWDGSVAASFSGGSGTADDPWKISNGSELAYLASVVNSNESDTHDKYYILTADIDLGGQEWIGIGNQNDAAKAFKGKFDGNGKVIISFRKSCHEVSHVFAFNAFREYRFRFTVDGKLNGNGNPLLCGNVGLDGYFGSIFASKAVGQYFNRHFNLASGRYGEHPDRLYLDSIAGGDVLLGQLESYLAFLVLRSGKTEHAVHHAAVLQVILGVLPDFNIIAILLRFYTVYIVWEGSKVLLRVSDKNRLRFTVMASVLLLLCPWLIEVLFGNLMMILN